MVCKTEKARSRKQREYVKRISKSKDAMLLDSGSDDDQIDSDNEFLWITGMNGWLTDSVPVCT